MRFFSLLLLGGLLPSAILAIWPNPASQSMGKSFIKIDANLQVILDPSTDTSRIPIDLQHALTETTKAICHLAPQPLEIDRGASYRSKIQQSKTLRSVQVTIIELLKTTTNACFSKRSQQPLKLEAENECSISYHTTKLPSTKTSSEEIKIHNKIPSNLSYLDAEAYELHVPDDGSQATLRAYTSLGAFRGLKTLEQIVWRLSKAQVFVPNAPITIADRPAFPYRGLLLDTARNFIPVEKIKTLVDTMALVKLNQFHWHITDSQSWPLAFDKQAGTIAKLSETGAYDSTMVYDEKTIKYIISYASSRGVNVNLEIDMPAHLKEGVEDLGKNIIACSDQDKWSAVAAEPPSGQLNLRPNSEAKGVPVEIASFVRSVLSRAAQLVRSPYLSSGGDEPNLSCWGLKAGDEHLIDDTIMKPFQSLVTSVLSSHKKLGMVWEEMAIKFPLTGSSLPPGTLVQAWTGPDNVAKILASNPGIHLIHAPYTHFYLDCGFGAWLGNSADGQSWCSYVTWQKMYSFDPFNGTKTEERGRVFGGEAALWSETIDQFNLEQRAWPRAAAGAEVFWTGEAYKVDGKMVKRDGNEALPRILESRVRMNERGVAAEPLQPLWCVLRRGRCNLV